MAAGRTKKERKQDNQEKAREQYERDKVSVRANYYKSKENILEKHLEKVECPCCKRIMSQNYVRIYQVSTNCLKRSE